MPGIAGIVCRSPYEGIDRDLNLMVEAMQHEEFYRSGQYVNRELGLYAGWTCLSGSFADCLPVWNEDRQVCLILSGEVVSDREEVKFLRSAGHQFESDNASYLVHLYEEIGPEFVTKLNGWFAGILIDSRKRNILLFNDRYAMERIYFHENERGFYFASEAKSLLRVLARARELDSQSLAEFLTCNCVLQDRTLFSGVSLVRGGSLWTFSASERPRKQFYFRRELWEAQPQLSAEEYYQRFKTTWKRILPRYFRPGERAALSLTGGVDSRMMLAWLRPEPGILPCYTWGSPYRDCFDVRLARRIARICRQPHQIVPVNEAFFSEFASLAEKAVYMSDGNSDVTGALNLYFHRIARGIAPIRLSGCNGGELLRRKISFKAIPLRAHLFTPDVFQLMEIAVETYAGELRGHKASFSAFKQASWSVVSALALERTQLTLRTPYLDNDLVALTYQAPPECLDIFFALRVISEGNPDLGKIMTDRGIKLNGHPSRKQIRHIFQQFTFKVEYAFDSGMPQWLARLDHMFAPLHLERLFLGRHQVFHFRVWYRDELSRYIRDILLDRQTLRRPYIQGKRLESIVRSHIKGTGNYTDEISRILTIELVQRHLLENRCF
jgi:asparagine synthase (glutamine-hydrolysing)